MFNKTEIADALAGASFALVMEAPASGFSVSLERYEKMTGLDSITLTQTKKKATHYLYLAESDYMNMAPTFILPGTELYDTHADKPIVIFYDDREDYSLQLYSAINIDGERTLLGELGRVDWGDYSL